MDSWGISRAAKAINKLMDNSESRGTKPPGKQTSMRPEMPMEQSSVYLNESAYPPYNQHSTAYVASGILFTESPNVMGMMNGV